jgi:hypothetical protein
MIVNLNLHRAEPWRDFSQFFPRNNVTTFHRHNFIFGNITRGKQTASMDFALAHLRFEQTIGKGKHC